MADLLPLLGVGGGSLSPFIGSATLKAAYFSDQGVTLNTGTGNSLTNGLVAYYKMDEASGTVCNDSSGNSYNGTYVNSLTVSTAVPAVQFSDPYCRTFSQAASSQIVIPSFTFPTAAFTVAWWLNLTDSGSTGFPNWFDTQTDPGTTGVSAYLSHSDAHPRITFKYGDGTTTHDGTLTNSNIGSYGAWIHAAITWDGSFYRLYINGALTTTSASGLPAPVTTSQNFYIGSSSSNVSIDGSLDDFRIYNRALNPAEISALAAGVNTAYGISQWNDQSGNGNNLTQATSAAQPLLVTSVINAYPAVVTDGIQKFLKTTFGVSLIQPYTVLFVTQQSALNIGSNSALIGTPSGGSSGNVVMQLSGATANYAITAGTRQDAGYRQDLNWHIHAYTFNAASSTGTLDGGQTFIFSGSVGTNLLDGIVTGATYLSGSPGNFLSEYLTAILVYSGTPSAPDLSYLMSGLAQKYNLRLAYDNFVAPNGTNLTTHTMNQGAGWQTIGGDTYQINSNTANLVTKVSDFPCAVTNTGSANVSIYETITMNVTTSNAHGIALRRTFSGGSTSGWTVNVTSTALNIIEIVSGTPTSRASAAATVTNGVPFPLAASANGTTITASFNNAVTLVYNSAATNQTVTYHGIADNNTNSPAAQHANWSCYL